MRKWISLLLAVTMTLGVVLSGCAKEPKKTGNSIVNAYMDAAKGYVASGDYEAAISALEEGITKTQDESLKKYLEEVKAMASPEPSDGTTEPSENDSERPPETPDEPTQDAYADFVGRWGSDSFDVTIGLNEGEMTLQVRYMASAQTSEEFTATLKTDEILDGCATFSYQATSGSTGDCIIRFEETRLTLEFTNLEKNDAELWIPEAIYAVKRSAQTDGPDTPDTPDNPDNPDTPDNPDSPDTPDNPDSPDTPDTPDTPVPKPQMTVEKIISDYSGEWAKPGTNYYYGGIYLEFYYMEGQGFGSGNSVLMDLYYVQEEPRCRKASISVEIIESQIKGNTLTVPFEDYEWGGQGNVVICFVDANTITCEVTNFVGHPVAGWGLDFSKTELIRSSNTYDKLQGQYSDGSNDVEQWRSASNIQWSGGVALDVDYIYGGVNFTVRFFGSGTATETSIVWEAFNYDAFNGNTVTFAFEKFFDSSLSGQMTIKMTANQITLTIDELQGGSPYDILWDYVGQTVILNCY